MSVKSESAVARRGSRAEAPLTVFLGTGYQPSLAPSGSDPDLGNGDGDWGCQLTSPMLKKSRRRSDQQELVTVLSYTHCRKWGHKACGFMRTGEVRTYGIIGVFQGSSFFPFF